MTSQMIRASVVLLLLAQWSAAEAKKAFFWQAEHGGKVISLLGSFHLATKDMYPLPVQVEEAFKQSQVVMVEARIDQVPASLQAEILSRGMYTPPDELPKHISAAAWKQTKAAAGKLGLPVMALQRMKPWMAATTVSVLAVKQIGFDQSRGIEMHFLRKAGSRSVKELENALFQLKLLDGLSPKEQEAFLVYSIKQAKSVKAEMRRFVRAWKRGDHRGMDRLLTKDLSSKSPALKSMYKRLVIDRNHSMCKTLDRLVKKMKQKRYFVIVGAAHMVGKQGMVELMRKKGYAFKQR